MHHLMRIVTLWAVAISLSACAALAAQQAPKEELQQFVVLQSDRLVTTFESLTGEQAQCAISGTANFASMRCQIPPGTAKASYHYVTALVVDKQGKAYGIACHESLLNVWCKKIAPGIAIQGSFDNGQKFLSIADGQKLHQYRTLTSAVVGALPPSQPAPAPPPSAKAKQPRVEPAAPTAPAAQAPSANGNPVADSERKTQSDTSSSSSGPSSAPSSAACVSPTASCVTFVSEPSGADVYVDGKFVGSTPSSLTLPAGSHEIRVEAGRFKPWTRTLSSTAGSTVTIHAALAKK